MPIGILCRRTDTFEVTIVHIEDAGSVDSVEPDIGVIVHGRGCTEQPDDEIDVVDIQVAERTAAVLRVKSRGHIALKIPVVAAGILRIVTLHKAYPAQLRQKRLYGLHVRHIEKRHRLYEHQSPVVRKTHKRLSLIAGHAHGFFYNDIPICLQRFQGKAVVGGIDIGDVEEIGRVFTQQFTVIGVDTWDAVLRSKPFGTLHIAVGIDGLHAYAVQFTAYHLKNFTHYLARTYCTYRHENSFYNVIVYKSNLFPAISEYLCRA